ncbi:MAG: ABC transporter permease [Chloroflexota bacterium]
MAIYSIRRFFQSLLFVVLASLLVYTGVVIWMPTGPKWQYDKIVTPYHELVASHELGTDENGKPLDPERVGFENTIMERWKGEIAQMDETWKLDKPWPLNFFTWLFDPNDTTEIDDNGRQHARGIHIDIGGWTIQGSGILTGNFGKSIGTTQRPDARTLIEGRAGRTLLLMGVSLMLSFLIAIPVGILGATRKDTRLGHVLTFMTLAGRSIPPFALGVVIVLFLAVVPYQLHTTAGWTWMPYLPAAEPFDDGQDNNWMNWLYHLILPAVTLAIIQVAWIARFVRSTMIEVLSQDYIRTAHSKGVSPRRVIFKHAMRNALIPLITIIGLLLPGLISGATIVEQVFSYEGLGMLYYRALGGTFSTTGLNPDTTPPPIGNPLDYPVVMVITIMLIAVVAFSNMLTDILYAVADPRVNYS